MPVGTSFTTISGLVKMLGVTVDDTTSRLNESLERLASIEANQDKVDDLARQVRILQASINQLREQV